jgi:hypothetical protein
MQMQLDEYVVGKPEPRTGRINKSTFCYRLEFGMPEFGGVGGRSARKFGIHFDKKSQTYDYDKKTFGASGVVSYAKGGGICILGRLAGIPDR